MNTKLLPLIFLFIVQTGFSQIPKTMTYQGVLNDASGTPLPDGTYNLAFRIYDTKSDGEPLWTEGRLVLVMNGIFNVILGEITPLSLSFDRPYWLGVQVGTEPELTPRTRFASVAYSFKSVKTDTGGTAVGAVGGDLAGTFPTAKVVGFQGNPIAETSPDVGDVLTWDAANEHWRPSPDARSKLWMHTGDNVFRTTGKVGVGTDRPDALVDIRAGSSDTFMVIESNTTKVFEMNRRSGVRDFINMKKSGSTVVSIEGDGDMKARSLQLSGSISAGGAVTASGSADFSTVTATSEYEPDAPFNSGRLYRNSLPLAYGHITQSGNIATGYGIFEVVKEGTGRYRISVLKTSDMERVVIVNGVGGTPDDEIFTVDDWGPNNTRIYVTIVNGEGQRKDSSFGIVVFGTPSN